MYLTKRLYDPPQALYYNLAFSFFKTSINFGKILIRLSYIRYKKTWFFLALVIKKVL